MRFAGCVSVGIVFILAIGIEIVQPTCVLESDFGFKINCAFKKSGLFRVRNLGGLKAHASIGFSLGDELGFEQSLTNLDPSRRRSVNVKNGVPPNLIADTSSRPAVRQEKKAKQNRIMLRPIPTQGNRVNTAAVEKLTTLHKKSGSTMQPIMVAHVAPTPMVRVNPPPKVTMAKPLPMGVPPFKPLPPKEETLKVLPITATRKTYTPLQIPQSKGPGLAYQSENQHVSHNQISKMVSQMTHPAQSPHKYRLTENVAHRHQTTVNPFIPMPFNTALNIIPAPNMGTIQVPVAPINSNTAYSLAQNTISIQRTHTNPVSNVVDPVPHRVHELATQLYPPLNTKKVDDYNTISGYGDDTALNINKDDINDKIAEIAKAGNISMEAVEAAISLRQQQLLNKYAGIQVPATTTTTTTTQAPIEFQQQPQPHPQPQPEIFEVPVSQPSKSKRQPTSGKVMNAPREYYPVGYEKNFDDHFHSRVDLPSTNFHCGDQKYFPGLYGDEALGCMVFHVCALTDDGLVMKSFLCPESTLFDQTILKCNWWFYVDCANSRRLYDTNIPVSKSYQLMKALTFFSNYKKDGMDDANGTNPEDIEGIKEAITILENHEPTSKQQTVNVQIVTPEPTTSEIAPVYRNNRNYKNTPRNNTNNRSNEDSRIFRIGTSINFSNRSTTNQKATDNSSKITENTKENQSRERQHRRRLMLNTKDKSSKSTTESPFITSTFVPQPTTAEIEIEQQEMMSMNQYYQRPLEQNTKYDKPIDHIDLESESTNTQDSLTPIKRIYRSSAEINDKDQFKVNPTPVAKLVGEVSTPLAAIEKLDEAILGKSLRYKKDTIFVVTPEKLKSRDIST